MRRFVDLHTHSTASDGALAPAELVALADRKRLAALALTDHDTTAGLADARAAAKAFPLLRFVPGIEVSAAFPTGTLHILGLGIHDNSAALARLAVTLRAARDDRNPKIITKLQSLGLKISMDDLWHGRPARGPEAGCRGRGVGGHADTHPPVLGRLHIAHALLAKGYVRTLQEAFDRYIGRDAPAFVEKDKLRPRAVLAALHAAGGLSVLAHPTQLQYANSAQLEHIVRDLADAGLDAIEAYHPDHTARQTRAYLALAQRFNLGVTGGSDFHGPAKPTVLLGRPKVSVTMLSPALAARLLGSPAPAEDTAP